MAELDSIDNLVAAREFLKSRLEKSRELAFAIDKTGPRLEDIKQRLPSLEAAIKTIGRKCSLSAIREHIDGAVGPAAAVLKVFDAVHDLEESLLSEVPCSSLFRYLSVIKQLEEALRFLTDNCRLVIQWLEDVVIFLEDNKVDDDRYMLNINMSLRILGELRATEERSRLSGGSLCAAFEKLETEFRHIVMENSYPPLEKLEAIMERLTANNRLEKCLSIYVEVRSSNARATLQALDLHYLEISLSEFDSVQSIEGYIDEWGKHLEFAVKHVFAVEYKLCSDVFDKYSGWDVWMGCFAKIAIQSGGMQAFIKFGNTVTRGKKDALKLLKLLEIFAALNRLRLDFNRLFGGTACIEIQTQTRDLIKKVVEGACEIFWELSFQVELQRQRQSDATTVPRLVSFVTDYCNHLLDDKYRPILTQVLEIHRSWDHEKLEEGLLSNHVHNIVEAIELNLETWAKTHEDTAFFMMNSHWCLYKNLKGTKLGDLMGDDWLRVHEKQTEYYAAVYLRESWGKLPALLSEEGLILFPGGRAIARDQVKKRLKAFSEAFEDMYKKQSSNWAVSDKSLRGKTCELVVDTIVPVYRSFLHKYMPLVEVEQEASPNSYTAESLEIMLRSLFQPKLGNYGATKCTHLIGGIKNVVTNHFSSTPAAA